MPPARPYKTYLNSTFAPGTTHQTQMAAASPVTATNRTVQKA